MQLGDSGGWFLDALLTSLRLGRLIFGGGQIHSLGTGFYLTSRAQGVFFVALRVSRLTSLLLGRVVFRGGQIHSLETGFYFTSRAQGVFFVALRVSRLISLLLARLVF